MLIFFKTTTIYISLLNENISSNNIEENCILNFWIWKKFWFVSVRVRVIKEQRRKIKIRR